MKKKCCEGQVYKYILFYFVYVCIEKSWFFVPVAHRIVKSNKKNITEFNVGYSI